MTNHWRDIKHADLILINGANPAEAHPVGFQWFVKAKLDPTKGPGSGGGAKIIHADPRYTRTSALADMYLRIRTGTDVAYFCDTEGGSSGSPVLSRDTGKVVALHHFGGCPNSGVRIDLIYAALKPLL